MTQVTGLSVAIEDKTQQGKAGVVRSIDEIVRKAKTLDTSADSATEALKEMADNGLKAVKPAAQGATEELNRMRDAQGRLNDASGRFVSEGRKVGDELKRTGENATEARRSMDAFGQTLARLQTFAASAIAGLSFGVVVRQAREYLEATTLIDNRLRLVSRSAVELATVQERVFSVANATRNDVGSTAELYQRLADSTKDLGTSQDDLFQVLTTINQAVATAGVRSETASAGLQQFAQALAANRFQGDELRSVFENLPPLADAIAAGLGVTKAEVRELGAEGLLTTRKLVTALLNQGDEVQARFARTSTTLGQGTTLVENRFIALAGAMDSAFQVTNKFATAAGSLATALDDVTAFFKDPLVQKALSIASTTATTAASGALAVSQGGVNRIGPASDVAGAIVGRVTDPETRTALLATDAVASAVGDAVGNRLDRLFSGPAPSVRIPTPGLDPANYLRDFQERVDATQGRRDRNFLTLESSRQTLGRDDFPGFSGTAIDLPSSADATRAIQEQIKKQEKIDAEQERSRREELRQVERQQSLLTSARERFAEAQISTEIAQLEAHQANRAQIIARQNDLELAQLQRRQTAELEQLRTAGGGDAALNELKQVQAAETALAKARGENAIEAANAADANERLSNRLKDAHDKIGLVSTAFGGLSPTIDDFLGTVQRAAAALASNNPLGALAEGVGFLSRQFFGARTENDRLIDVLRNVELATERATDSLNRFVQGFDDLTQSELNQRSDLAEIGSLFGDALFEDILRRFATGGTSARQSALSDFGQGLSNNLDALPDYVREGIQDTRYSLATVTNLLSDFITVFDDFDLNTAQSRNSLIDSFDKIIEAADRFGEIDTSTFGGALEEYRSQVRLQNPQSQSELQTILAESFSQIAGFNFGAGSVQTQIELTGRQTRTLEELLAEIEQFSANSSDYYRESLRSANSLYFDKEEIALRQRFAQAFTGIPENDREVSRAFDRQIDALYQIRLAYERNGALPVGSGTGTGGGTTIPGGGGSSEDISKAVGEVLNNALDNAVLPDQAALEEYLHLDIAAAINAVLERELELIEPIELKPEDLFAGAPSQDFWDSTWSRVILGRMDSDTGGPHAQLEQLKLNTQAHRIHWRLNDLWSGEAPSESFWTNTWSRVILGRMDSDTGGPHAQLTQLKLNTQAHRINWRINDLWGGDAPSESFWTNTWSRVILGRMDSDTGGPHAQLEQLKINTQAHRVRFLINDLWSGEAPSQDFWTNTWSRTILGRMDSNTGGPHAQLEQLKINTQAHRIRFLINDLWSGEAPSSDFWTNTWSRTILGRMDSPDGGPHAQLTQLKLNTQAHKIHFTIDDLYSGQAPAAADWGRIWSHDILGRMDAPNSGPHAQLTQVKINTQAHKVHFTKDDLAGVTPGAAQWLTHWTDFIYTPMTSSIDIALKKVRDNIEPVKLDPDRLVALDPLGDKLSLTNANAIDYSGIRRRYYSADDLLGIAGGVNIPVIYPYRQYIRADELLGIQGGVTVPVNPPPRQYFRGSDLISVTPVYVDVIPRTSGSSFIPDDGLADRGF